MQETMQSKGWVRVGHQGAWEYTHTHTHTHTHSLSLSLPSHTHIHSHIHTLSLMQCFPYPGPMEFNGVARDADKKKQAQTTA